MYIYVNHQWMINTWLKQPHIFFPIVKGKTKPDVCIFKCEFVNPIQK